MNIFMTTDMLIDLVKSQSPGYELFHDEYEDVPIEGKEYEALGRYMDNSGFTWYTEALKKFNKQQLFGLYRLCKRSHWKRDNQHRWIHEK